MFQITDDQQFQNRDQLPFLSRISNYVKKANIILEWVPKVALNIDVKTYLIIHLLETIANTILHFNKSVVIIKKIRLYIIKFTFSAFMENLAIYIHRL